MAVFTSVELSPPAPGDLGWIVSRHGEVYAREFGYDADFEGLVARIVGDYQARLDPAREAVWIAQRRVGDQRERLGCVMLVQARDDTTDAPLPGVAQLRLLLVEPAGRGTGLGARLVAECTRFARAAGYTRLQLWTQSHLEAARALYRHEGYRLAGTEAHHSFGQDLVGEIWTLDL